MNPFIQPHKQTSIFITAGFPHENSLSDQIPLIQMQGVDFIEIGIPFSDPLADGPTIQQTSSIALENGMTIKLLFQQLEELQKKISVPIVLMGYLNPVMQYGIEPFLKKCAGLNIGSLILPDLTYELYVARYKSLFEQFQISVSFLVTPRTDNERILLIAKECSNSFVYLVSQNSITGNSFDLNTDLSKRYQEINDLCGETPLFLGFGIDTNEKRKAAFKSCDGVIVGTAYLKSIHTKTEEIFLSNLLAD